MSRYRCFFAGTLLAASFAQVHFAQAQVPDAPLPAAPTMATSAPTASSPARSTSPVLTVPAPIYDRPTGLQPLRETNDYCFAPASDKYPSHGRVHSQPVPGSVRAYKDLLRSVIFNDWQHHMSISEKNVWGAGRFVAVRFVIQHDGSHGAPELTHSGGKDVYDEHVLDAIRTSSPFPPLPEGVNSLRMCLVVGFHLEGVRMPPEATRDWAEDPTNP